MWQVLCSVLLAVVFFTVGAYSGVRCPWVNSKITGKPLVGKLCPCDKPCPCCEACPGKCCEK